MPYLKVNGIQLYYEERGNGNPVLCIHGTSGSALMWEAAADTLAPLGRIITYDRRGCTRSERPVPYDRTMVSEHADDAAALLRALDATPAVVIGRSTGGEIAVDLALRYPAEVRALVLLEGGGTSLTADGRRYVDDMAAMLREVAFRDPSAVGETLLRAVADDGAWESFSPEVQRMFTDNGPAILAELAGGAAADVSIEQLARLDRPTLLVAATDSPEPERLAVDALAEAIPGARKVVVAGGHLIDPAGPAVLAFLTDILHEPTPRLSRTGTP